MAHSTIKACFDKDDQERSSSLDRVRLCCALSLPWLEPPVGHSESQKLPQNYQSVVSRGVVGLAGQSMTTIFPAQLPWLHLVPDPEVYDTPNADPDIIGAIEDELLRKSVHVQAALDATNVIDGDSNPVGFRSAQRQKFTQLYATGDVLSRQNDDLSESVFRRSQYVTKRSTDTKVLYHVIKEQKDPLGLSDEDREKAGLSDMKRETPVYERLKELYTIVEWQPWSKSWVIRQEMNDKQIAESEEKISPFFSVPFELSPGDNYGRGIVELNLGDARSFNALRERMLDFAALASKMTPVLDYSCQAKPRDLTKPTGEPIYARVANGNVQDIAFLTVDKLSDFRVVFETAESIRKDLGAAMLIQSEQVRQSERTTAFEIQAVSIKEMENVFGGVFTSINDGMTLPLARRTIHVLQKKRKMPKFKEGTVQVKILTGVAALARASKISTLLTVADIASKLGPETTAKLDKGVLLDTIARYANLNVPGLIKTDEQLRQEQENAIRTAAAAQATTTAIDTAGKVAESVLTGGQ